MGEVNSMNLDRFSHGLIDTQDVSPLHFCHFCGGEIYPGETVVVINQADIVHEEEAGFTGEEDLVETMSIEEALEVC
jgi:hypothetical protein